MQPNAPTANVIKLAKHMQYLIERGIEEGNDMSALEVTCSRYMARYNVTDEMLLQELER